MDSSNSTDLQIDFNIDWSEIAHGLNEFEEQILPFLAFGVPYVQVAEFFGVHKSTISKRFELNKNFARAVAQARKIVKWELHRVFLNQKAVKAWSNLDWFLSVNPLEKEDGKYVYEDVAIRRLLMSEKAKVSRFIVDQLGLRVHKVEVEHNTPPPMFIGDESAAAMVIDAINKTANEESTRTPKEIAAEYRLVKGQDRDKETIPFKLSEEEREAPLPWDKKSVQNLGKKKIPDV